MHPEKKARLMAFVVMVLCVVALLAMAFSLPSCTWGKGVLTGARIGGAYGNIDAADGDHQMGLVTLDFPLFPEKKAAERAEYPWPNGTIAHEDPSPTQATGGTNEKETPPHLADDWYENEKFLVWLERIIVYIGGVLTAMLAPKAKGGIDKLGTKLGEIHRRRKQVKEESPE